MQLCATKLVQREETRARWGCPSVQISTGLGQVRRDKMKPDQRRRLAPRWCSRRDGARALGVRKEMFIVPFGANLVENNAADNWARLEVHRQHR